MKYVALAKVYFKAHWVTIMALGAALWAYAGPTVLDFVHNHPKYSFYFGLVSTVVTFYVRQNSVQSYLNGDTKP